MGWHAFAKYIFIFLISDKITSILSLLLLIYFALNSSVTGTGIFLKKEFTLSGFFVFLLRNQ